MFEDYDYSYEDDYYQGGGRGGKWRGGRGGFMVRARSSGVNPAPYARDDSPRTLVTGLETAQVCMCVSVIVRLTDNECLRSLHFQLPMPRGNLLLCPLDTG